MSSKTIRKSMKLKKLQEEITELNQFVVLDSSAFEIQGKLTESQLQNLDLFLTKVLEGRIITEEDLTNVRPPQPNPLPP